MDLITETLADSRACRTLKIVDDGSRGSVAIEGGRSLPGARVVRVLEHLRLTIGLPRAIVVYRMPVVVMNEGLLRLQFAEHLLPRLKFLFQSLDALLQSFTHPRHP